MNTLLKYIDYKLFAKHKKGHGVHSPFVFELITKVFNDFTCYKDYVLIEEYKQKLLRDERIIEVRDLGAGSRKNRSNSRSISEIAKTSVQKAKYARLLYRIVKYYNVSSILELGTSLGITSMYLSKACHDGKLITIEACPEISKIARNQFEQMKLYNITLVNDSFENVLIGLKNTEVFDLIYIDGNHRKEPTLRYFNTLINHIHSNSVMVLDDIYWSSEMSEAWSEIQAHDKTVVSIDLFKLGLIFFDSSLTPGHYVIKY